MRRAEAQQHIPRGCKGAGCFNSSSCCCRQSVRCFQGLLQGLPLQAWVRAKVADGSGRLGQGMIARHCRICVYIPAMQIRELAVLPAGSPLDLVANETLRNKMQEPLNLLGKQRFANIDIRVRAKGGGHVSQAYGEQESPAVSAAYT